MLLLNSLEVDDFCHVWIKEKLSALTSKKKNKKTDDAEKQQKTNKQFPGFS